MATSELRFRVTEEGKTLPAVAAENEKALARLQKAAEQTARVMGTSATSAVESASRASTAIATKAEQQLKRTFSPEMVNSLIEPLSAALGQSSPMISRLTMGVTRFGEGMKEASLGSQVLARGMVALGVAAAGMMERFQEGERISTRMAGIDRATRGLDSGALRQGITETATEIDALERRMSTWAGAGTMMVQSIIKTALGLPNAFEEANAAMAKLREGFAATLPVMADIERAGVARQASGLNLRWGQTYLQDLKGRGELSADTSALVYRQMEKEVGAGASAGMQELWGKYRTEMAAASASGVADIEGPRIRERYLSAVGLLTKDRDISIMAVRSTAAEEQRGILSQQEQSRATLAASALATGKARLDSLGSQATSAQAEIDQAEAARKYRLDMIETMRVSDDEKARLRGIVGPGGYRSNPALYQYSERLQQDLITAERDLTLKTIDETTTKQLASIQQMRVADEERERMKSALQTQSAAERQAALDTALNKETALVAQMKALRDAATLAAASIKDGILSPFEQAAAAVGLLGEGVSSLGSGSSTGTANGAVSGVGNPGPGMSLDAYWKRVGLMSGESSYDKNVINDWAKAGATITQSEMQKYMEAGVTGDLETKAQLRRQWEASVNINSNKGFKGIGAGTTFTGSGGDYNLDAYGAADGALFTTRGATRMVVGEAGTEAVAVIKNPRAVDVGGGASQPIMVVVQLDGKTIAASQIKHLEEAIAAGEFIVRAP